MMCITRIRLINFHNFVDETIEVPAGGHLFLLGDNGSGKTTVLDAIHYVLSGGQAIELNAAARMGGRRDEGRSLQGIVLRHDFERGVEREGGAVAYAALELSDHDSSRQMVIGIGAEATTLEARATRWGFVTRRPLEEVPLLLEQDGESFPVSRDGLRTALGASEVFFRIGDYRASVAARLFGGPAAYAEVCRFWSMAKAYREIVSGSRDFGSLFRRLLPAPDPAVFGDILRSLRHIADLEVALGELEDHRRYVAGLLELAGDIDEQRRAAARYRWLACFRRGEELAGELEASGRSGEELDAERARLGREVEAAEARLEQADDAVRAARSADAEGLADRLRQAEARLAEQGGELAQRERLEARRADDERVARAQAERAGDALAVAVAGVRGVLDRALEGAIRAPGELPRSRELRARMDAGGPADWRDAAAAAAAEAAALREHAGRRLDEAAAQLERARVEEERHAGDLEALRQRQEEAPRVDGFAAAIGALEGAGIAARPLYDLLEPGSAAAPERLAWIESMAGDPALATLIVAPADRRRAVSLIAPRCPGVRVLVRTVEEAALPSWAAALFEPAADDGARAALGALAAAISEAPGLGPVAEADEHGVLEHRGAGFAPERAEPRLLGRAARRRAHQLRIAAAEAALADAAAQVAAAAGALDLARQWADRIGALAAAIAEATGPELVAREAAAHAATAAAAVRAEQLAEASARTGEWRARVADLEARASALRARAQAVGLDEIRARVAELEAPARGYRDRWRDLQAALGACAASLERERRRRAALEESLADSAAQLARLADEVRRICGLGAADDAALAHHVRVAQRGDSFKSIETIRARIDDCVRREAVASAELGGDGSRGIRNIHHAARFGFTYLPAENRLIDRRDQPAAGVLAELDRVLGEQRGVITTETRELMETLVMSSLARDLQSQVERLDRMIKDINRLLGGIRFGRAEYQFRASARPERRDLVELVRRVSLLDTESREAFRTWIDDRLDELRGAEDGVVPDLLDYRSWYDYTLRLRTPGTDGVDLTRTVRALGSGGEQGVPNYLLVLALGALMFDSAGAATRPLLFDEAFYGIDAGRRDQLLRFATELGLQIVVASPDQDGVTSAVRAATTLFIVKDPHGDVHLAPYHYWHNPPAAQPDLFTPAGPSAPDPAAAECRVPPGD